MVRGRIAVIIPCYRAGHRVSAVIKAIGPEIERIYVVDDACPDDSAGFAARVGDKRVRVLHNPRNLGVGGAVKRGYAAALADGMAIAVKLDADGQMDPAQIGLLIAPILAGTADYTKGNRFAPLRDMPEGGRAEGERAMPRRRRIGNALASIVHKGVTGQWHIVDPANGFTAIHRAALSRIDLSLVADCYFFETDMLMRLNLAEAVVADVALPARYGSEVSSLRVRNMLMRYPLLALRRTIQRLWQRYFVRGISGASVCLTAGIILVLLGATLAGLPGGTEPVTYGFIVLGVASIWAALRLDYRNRPLSVLSARPVE